MPRATVFSATATVHEAYLALNLGGTLLEGSKCLHGMRQSGAVEGGLRGHRPGQDRLEGSDTTQHSRSVEDSSFNLAR